MYNRTVRITHLLHLRHRTSKLRDLSPAIKGPPCIVSAQTCPVLFIPEQTDRSPVALDYVMCCLAGQIMLSLFCVELVHFLPYLLYVS